MAPSGLAPTALGFLPHAALLRVACLGHGSSPVLSVRKVELLSQRGAITHTCSATFSVTLGGAERPAQCPLRVRRWWWCCTSTTHRRARGLGCCHLSYLCLDCCLLFVICSSPLRDSFAGLSCAAAMHREARGAKPRPPTTHCDMPAEFHLRPRPVADPRR
jgi:hypothetical protein